MLSLGALIDGRILCIHPVPRNKTRYERLANLVNRLDTKCKPAVGYQE